MLPRSLNRVATKSSTTAAVAAKPKQLSIPHLSRRTFVHPSRADRAAVVELPTHSPSIPPGTFSILFSFISHFLTNRPFNPRPSLQTRPTTTPTTNLRSKPDLPRCSGLLFLPLTTQNSLTPSPFPQATTAMDPRVLDAMMPFSTDMYGNPHSRTHAYGWEAEHAVDEARRVSLLVFGSLSRGGSSILRRQSSSQEW
jgi:hypothetical protein